MEAIVLAGGLGTRLRSVVPDLPKPMAPVAGRPFLEIVLDALARQGFSRVVLSVGYQSQVISGHFGSWFQGMEVAYAVEDTPLGTGGAIRLALTMCREDPVFVLNGDTYLELEAAPVKALWTANRRPVIVAREVPDTARYGRLRTDGQRVVGMTEKGAGGPGLINAGCYLLARDALDGFPAGQPFSLERDYLQELVARQPVDLHVAGGAFIDIGVPEDYGRAQGMFAGGAIS